MEKQYDQARLQFQQGLSTEPLKAAEGGYRDSSAYPDLNWKFRILTAEARIRVDQYKQASDILQPEPPANLSKNIFLRRWLIQAYAHCYMNEYDSANQYFERAEAVQKETGLNEADLDYFRGRCELLRRASKKTDEYLHKALDSITPDNLALKARILVDLAYSAESDFRTEEAIDWYTQHLAVARALHAPLLEEQALGRRGLDYLNLNDLVNAQKDAQEAEAIASNLKLASDEQKWLFTIGGIQHNQGQLGKAEQTYKRALAIAMDQKDSRDIDRLLENLTIIKILEGDLKAAEQYHEQGAQIAQSVGNMQTWQLNDARISLHSGNYNAAIQKLKNLLEKMDNDTRSGTKVFYKDKWNVESNLGRTYAAMGDNANAEKWFLKGIDTVDQATRATQNERYKTTIRDNIPIYDAYVELLVHQNQPEKALQVSQLGRARSLLSETAMGRMENPKVWLSKVQHIVRNKNAILLSYYATEKNCYLWVVSPAKIQMFTLGVSEPDISSMAASYRSEVQNHQSIDSSPASKRLFQILVQPALQLVPKGSNVMVLADSSIYSLNFETLISPEGSNHYWIDDVDVQYANSIDLLMQPNRASSPAKGLLLIGAPIQVSPQFPLLPHAPQEMESVRKHFSQSDVTEFRDTAATPESYTLGSPGRFKYVHFATHGTANALQPLQSAIILSPGKEGEFKLLAQTIAGNTLHLNADLVTISACEGTGTQVQSLEGLLGLEWAFMRAGARQVVAALWDVDDTVTPGLMDDFYDGLKKGESTAEALRHAKLKILHGNSYYSAPYYWAPLQVYTRS